MNRPPELLILLGGVALGLAIGLAYSWLIDPVELYNTTPPVLRIDYRHDWIRLAALGYVEKEGANVHNNRAQTYLERGEYEKALAEYRRALEMEPRASRLWSNYGMAYLRMEAYE